MVWIMQLELVARDRLAHVVFELAALARLGFHGRLEEAVAVAALGLGPVQRKVGVLEQRIGVDAIVRRQGDADARPDRHLAAIEVVGLGNRGEDAVGEDDHAVLAIPLDGLEDGEFVATQPRDVIGIMRHPPQPLRDDPQ